MAMYKNITRLSTGIRTLLSRTYCKGTVVQKTQVLTGNVPGLSKAVIKESTSPVGPGASKSGVYKNPEYFSYHETSYFDAEIEMLKYRCPQPSALQK